VRYFLPNKKSGKLTKGQFTTGREGEIFSENGD
jgi:hypothetical protein